MSLPRQVYVISPPLKCEAWARLNAPAKHKRTRRKSTSVLREWLLRSGKKVVRRYMVRFVR